MLSVAIIAQLLLPHLLYTQFTLVCYSHAFFQVEPHAYDTIHLAAQLFELVQPTAHLSNMAQLFEFVRHTAHLSNMAQLFEFVRPTAHLSNMDYTLLKGSSVVFIS
ncbi:hypothetical protein B9Z55_000711 [Caenorhabditis nigoni]|uniref:NR LBD domain-containing protein n=1 Tax=Caenorhabditis nigoni TaxID=1611254 RepID=A0A2G5VUW0_9PELO|nr:hypothetical protein B9Z55_000711 [Caenorhabditis nigoni]